MKIEIDKSSGFCFGVVNAIKIAEESLKKEGQLFCLGDIVHNGEEIHRLVKMGLITVSREEYFTLKNCSVLIRAHGEPPETYKYASENNITLIDATCPVVIKLQKKIKKAYEESKLNKGQIVIYGKKGHAEVVGLNGQTNNEAIILEGEQNLNMIDYTKPVTFFSQTTKSVHEFNRLTEKIKSELNDHVPFKINDTICRQVANRVPKLEKFVSEYELILFVSGKKSSNGRFLFETCRKKNPNTHFISTLEELKPEWLSNVKFVGICGATSTPQWLMENVADWVEKNS